MRHRRRNGLEERKKYELRKKIGGKKVIRTENVIF